ncbi:hypothetical protein JW721_01290 [Candidatus Micrarchaeota archaeon]|nr:hypothetical protein [Candidatus Micrarchaeota archaeon]
MEKNGFTRWDASLLSGSMMNELVCMGVPKREVPEIFQVCMGITAKGRVMRLLMGNKLTRKEAAAISEAVGKAFDIFAERRRTDLIAAYLERPVLPAGAYEKGRELLSNTWAEAAAGRSLGKGRAAAENMHSGRLRGIVSALPSTLKRRKRGIPLGMPEKALVRKQG